MGKDKIEMTVVTTTALESSDTILPASPDIVKRGRTFPFLLRETASWRAWRDTARADLKSMRWLRAVMWTAIVFWVYVLVMVVTSLATMAIQSPDSGFRIPDFIDHFLGVFGLQLVSRSFSNYNACQPNGGFSIVPNSYRWWSMGDFFEITIGFSSLSFTQAKLLDILWGIVSQGCDIEIHSFSAQTDGIPGLWSARPGPRRVRLLEGVCRLPHDFDGDNTSYIHHILGGISAPRTVSRCLASTSPRVLARRRAQVEGCHELHGTDYGLCHSHPYPYKLNDRLYSSQQGFYQNH